MVHLHLPAGGLAEIRCMGSTLWGGRLQPQAHGLDGRHFGVQKKSVELAVRGHSRNSNPLDRTYLLMTEIAMCWTY